MKKLIQYSCYLSLIVVLGMFVSIHIAKSETKTEFGSSSKYGAESKN